MRGLPWLAAAALLSTLSAACSNGNGLLRTAPILAQGQVKRPAIPIVGGCADIPPRRSVEYGRIEYPVDPRSDAYIASIPGNLHPDFGRIPLRHSVRRRSGDAAQGAGAFRLRVAERSRAVPNSAGRANRRRKTLQRRPPRARPATGRVQTLRDVARVPERRRHKTWRAGSGAIFPLDTNKLRPDGWTSADAAGLPILPALVKCAEVQPGTSITRCDLPWKIRKPATFIRQRTLPATAVTRTFRRWDCAFV